MSLLTIDLETRSAVPLKEGGAYRYAEHWSTDILCLAIKVEDRVPCLWIPEKFRSLWPDESITDAQLTELIYHSGTHTVSAHNCQFERALWKSVMTNRYGFPEIPLELWHCTAAKAAAMNIPRHLDGACKVLGLPGKDKAGYNVMMRMCKNRKPRKKEVAWLYEDGALPHPTKKYRWTRSDGTPIYLWHEKPEDFQANCKYCLNDVEIEYALDKALPDLSDEEMLVWRMDQRINDRGVHVDLPAVTAMVNSLHKYEEKLSGELARLTHGQVTAPSEGAKLTTWLKTRGVDMKSLQIADVKAMAKVQDIDPSARRALEIRESGSKATSCSKYDAMLRTVCEDGRIHGMLLYYGAQATGRWSSRLVQLQNLPRGTMKMEEIEHALWVIENMDISLLDGNPLDIGSSCVRSVLTAAPGHDLICSDFSNIEGRGQAWLAGEAWKLAAFRDFDTIIGHELNPKSGKVEPVRKGPDLYKLAYSKSFDTPVDEVTKDQRQIGKVQELALGYAGGIKAYATMAGNYGFDLEVLPDMILHTATDEEREASEWTAQKFFEREAQWNREVEMSMHAAISCDILKRRWRAAHPHIVGFWASIEEAAIKTVHTRQAHQVGRIMFAMRGQWLHMQLPSKRYLSMFDPKVIPGDFGGEQLTFWGVDCEKKRWMCKRTYGGDLFQSAIQAIARDVMSTAALNLESAGYPTILMVHDEDVSEVPKGHGSQEEYDEIMARQPAWADGMPIAVEGWRGERYHK